MAVVYQMVGMVGMVCMVYMVGGGCIRICDVDVI